MVTILNSMPLKEVVDIVTEVTWTEMNRKQ